MLQGQGFLARFLICNERSIAGTRLLANRDLTRGPADDPLILNYWNKIASLLKRPIKINQNTGALELAVSMLKDAAFDKWCALHDGIEDQMKQNGRFRDIRPFASKAAEHAARIAAILAFIEDYHQPEVIHVERAGSLISYYLESMVIWTSEAQQDVNKLLARDLLRWIIAHNGKLSATDFKKLPNPLRKAENARKVLSLLVMDGHLRISENNIRTGKASGWEIIK